MFTHHTAADTTKWIFTDGQPERTQNKVMPLATFFGCTFIAFGPAFALFILTVARDPLRVIILIAGAFFWLVSLLLSSLVWFIATKASDRKNEELQHGLLIFGVLLSVLFQEVFRYGYYRLLRKAQDGLVTFSQDNRPPISMQEMAYVAGLGFGIISGAFSVVNILAQSIGPGTVGIRQDSEYFFLTSAFLTLAVILLHMCWGVVFFDGCQQSRVWAVLLVIALHFLVSSMTFLNPVYAGSLVPTYVVLVGMLLWAFVVAGGTPESLHRALTCSKEAD
ncbi:gamma-secretase subunit Aph-1b-like isoform X2 [Lethenteron reissneri]|uniref:gamma-secretase subunit Aph-1b-like isoform X2 n=1 Tax=Lethenteron reissneri TaxID=7753 RepID=UPI002AB72D36|nr:gamma-secretase subunit Aph-1b-like isoform X2 [Lethenteron reissneri]